MANQEEILDRLAAIEDELNSMDLSARLLKINEFERKYFRAQTQQRLIGNRCTAIEAEIKKIKRFRVIALRVLVLVFVVLLGFVGWSQNFNQASIELPQVPTQQNVGR